VTAVATDSLTLAQERTDLALDRTRLAGERTLMAWVRTATSLISFGFTIYKFFQYMQENERLAPVHHMFSPRMYGLTMITLGISGLAVATLQHHRDMKGLYGHYQREAPRSTAMLVASIVASLGVVALILVFFRQ